MNEIFTYDKYEFMIVCDDTNHNNSTVKITVTDTCTLDMYAGNISTSGNFYKILLGALNRNQCFSICITKSDNSLRCDLKYITEIIEIDKSFGLEQISNDKIIISKLISKITELETKNHNFELELERIKLQLSKP